ncbi:MAG: hypothetical protein LUH82_06810 [Clostridiales bacterium]|nr:hypothetical protein [Clostridiales bacterium]
MNMTNSEYQNRKAVALGDFDGMHLAHKTVVTGAGDVVIYCVNNRFSLLQKSIFERRYKNCVFADFAAIKDLSGEEFIKQIILGEYGARAVLCGFNFRFGRGALNSAMDMRRYLEKYDVWVRILEAQYYENEPISSTRIRKAVAGGNIKAANAMLGYNFTFESVVEVGDKRGRTIGFPTINQHLPAGLTVPKYGVYESAVYIAGKRLQSFTNIGVRPTWRVSEPLAETHIFNFDENLYGKTVQVELVRYLRGEKIFNDKQELKRQLSYDKSSII